MGFLKAKAEVVRTQLSFLSQFSPPFEKYNCSRALYKREDELKEEAAEEEKKKKNNWNKE